MVAVPEEHKDEKYWEKRLKNKEATRRSRETRGRTNIQISAIPFTDDILIISPTTIFSLQKVEPKCPRLP